MSGAAQEMHAEILTALGVGLSLGTELPTGGSLPSAFAVSDLAQASVGAAGSALSRYIALSRKVNAPAVRVDRDLASAWFATSVRAVGWEPSSLWDAVAGDYAGTDGWIRLHTNAPHHRAAALAVLDSVADRDAVADAVRAWPVQALESAVVAAAGAAAAMHSAADWAAHPVGGAVATEPLLWVDPGIAGPRRPGSAVTDRPLAGIRVLDLTRVIAGPVATRTLAGWGAEVLRIDPPDWDEGGGLLVDVLAGKRTARLDLHTAEGMRTFTGLLGGADVLVHGLRADALARLGLGWRERQAIRPGLIDVSLNAYGWWGPWVDRRGFDSLVQMSSGIADAGRAWADVERPTPLPVQALDHATGYIMAAAAVSGLTARLLTGSGSRWRTSLARTAALLLNHRASADGTELTVPEPLPDLSSTPWGDVRRLAPPVVVDGAPLRWTPPTPALGSGPAEWAEG
jgi:hypothetical protein